MRTFHVDYTNTDSEGRVRLDHVARLLERVGAPISVGQRIGMYGDGCYGAGVVERSSGALVARRLTETETHWHYVGRRTKCPDCGATDNGLTNFRSDDPRVDEPEPILSQCCRCSGDIDDDFWPGWRHGLLR